MAYTISSCILSCSNTSFQWFLQHILRQKPSYKAVACSIGIHNLFVRNRNRWELINLKISINFGLWYFSHMSNYNALWTLCKHNCPRMFRGTLWSFCSFQCNFSQISLNKYLFIFGGNFYPPIL
jgi:hypothetical protein